MFIYLGYTFFYYYEFEWSLSFIGWILLFTFVGRFLAVFVLPFIFYVFSWLFMKNKSRFTLSELSILQISGMSRGILGYILG
jgi:hypothetical protein